jgi:hypothetical protein
VTTPLTYPIEQAAQRLGGSFTVDWLKGHLDELPHIKLGKGTGRSGRIAFSEAHLVAIVAMFTVDPAPASQPGDFSSVRGRRRAS